jgi:hypothetical protein
MPVSSVPLGAAAFVRAAVDPDQRAGVGSTHVVIVQFRGS